MKERYIKKESGVNLPSKADLHTIYTPYGKIEHTPGTREVSSTAHKDGKPRTITESESITLKVMTTLPNKPISNEVLHSIFNNLEELGTVSNEVMVARMLRLQDKIGDAEGEVIRDKFPKGYALMEPKKIRGKLFYDDGEVLLKDGRKEKLSKNELAVVQTLSDQPGKRVSKERLVELIDSHANPETFRIQISKLKQKVDDVDLIRNDKKRGYYIDEEDFSDKKKEYVVGDKLFSATDRSMVHPDGRKVTVSPKQSLLLSVFLAEPGKKFSRAELSTICADAGWKEYINMDTIRLRKILGETTPLKTDYKGNVWIAT